MPLRSKVRQFLCQLPLGGTSHRLEPTPELCCARSSAWVFAKPAPESGRRSCFKLQVHTTLCSKCLSRQTTGRLAKTPIHLRYQLQYYLLVYCCWYRLYPKRRPIAVFARLVPRHGCPAPPRCHGSREAIGVRPYKLRETIARWGTVSYVKQKSFQQVVFSLDNYFHFFLSLRFPRFVSKLRMAHNV